MKAEETKHEINVKPYATDIVFLVGLVMMYVGIGIEYTWGMATLVCGSILMMAALFTTTIRIFRG